MKPCMTGYLAMMTVAVTLLGCQGHASESAKPYQLINTHLKSSGGNICWYDDRRLVFLKGDRLPAIDYPIEGLYYLDVTNPSEIKQVDIAPLDPSIHKEIKGVSCQDHTILFSLIVGNRERTRLYSVRIGEPAELLAEMRVGGVSLQGHYVIGSSRKTILDGGPLQGVFEGYDDCAVSYIKPGFKVHCWDLWLEKRWPLSKFVLMEYKWDDTIRVRGEDGTGKWIPNPAKRLMDKDGKPLQSAIFLRDLDNNILIRVDKDPTFIPWMLHGFVVTSDEMYAYAVCSLVDQRLFADRVCRYRLDGQQRQWEEVFRFDHPGKAKASIQQITLSKNLDVYFIVPARAPYRGIWKFDARSKVIVQISQPGDFNDRHPISSPNGNWVTFERSSKNGTEIFLGRGD